MGLNSGYESLVYANLSEHEFVASLKLKNPFIF